ncbi:DUF3347 domain-containing protein [Antarcticibacterium arcticum]|uniref:DUF3347 domain-containing protein n=1 Tax=Antarcticibacterium arcticum TaxID=2585771 RepID=A0A5B8YGP3_9FLAO|nr:DUF3347 domain-containing protein [Antarcticibacterium arcticum]QED37162.1 DUF3347 domain-containing protein [Antarcticibacterium arcticum]
MKNLKVNLGIAMLVIASLTAVSCKNNNEEGSVDHSTMDHENMNADSDMMEGGAQPSQDVMGSENEDSQTGRIVNDYLELKDALVADNIKDAAKAGEGLVKAFEEFDMSEYEEGQQQELTEIIEDAKEHAEHITMSDIAHQREHFDILSVDLADMLEITGSPKTLYQQFCPMYNSNKGAIWLSTSEEIRNPYFGQSMLTCGEVQKEI